LPISDVSTLSEQVARSYTNETLIAEPSGFSHWPPCFFHALGFMG